MHSIQRKIIDELNARQTAQMTLREWGEIVGETHPQKIKHHLSQLEKRGFIKIDGETGTVSFVGENCEFRSKFLNIPIRGAANCGPANILARDRIEGYLKVSRKILNDPDSDGKYFCVKTIGSSMNKAFVGGLNIDDGDYVIVDTLDRKFVNGDYVLSIIDGYANIKKLFVDTDNKQIVLFSESNSDFPPIYIHEEDLDEYLIVGKARYVMKKPIMSWSA